MWPIAGEGEEMRVALMHFLAQKLRLGEDVLADAEECVVGRVPTANTASKITHEIIAEFPTYCGPA